MASKGNVEKECQQCGVKFTTWASQVKRGGGKYCSVSCGTTYRNLTNNPTKDPEVRRRISENHAPTPWLLEYCANGYKGTEVQNYRVRALRHYGRACNRCGSYSQIHVHHVDRDRDNNELANLEVLCRSCHVAEHLDEAKIEAEKRRCPNTGHFLKGDGVIVKSIHSSS